MFWSLGFRILNLFRISRFGFRIFKKIGRHARSGGHRRGASREMARIFPASKRTARPRGLLGIGIQKRIDERPKRPLRRGGRGDREGLTFDLCFDGEIAVLFK